MCVFLETIGRIDVKFYRKLPLDICRAILALLCRTAQQRYIVFSWSSHTSLSICQTHSLGIVKWINTHVWGKVLTTVFPHHFLLFFRFLALLDYVSRAHEIEIHPSSIRPSVRPSVRGIDYLWSYCMDCFQISVVASPRPYAQTIFSFFKKKKKFDFLGFFFIFVNMGPYGSQNFKTLLLPQIIFESFQTFSEFSSHWS